MKHASRHIRSIVLAMLAITLSSAIAWGGPLENQLARTKQEQKHVQAALADMDVRQDRIMQQITSVNTRINEITVPINDLSARIGDLNQRIQHRRDRIAQLRIEFLQQKREIIKLDGELVIAQQRMAERLVAVYKDGDQGFEWLSGVSDMSDLFARRAVVKQVSERDDQIVDNIAGLQQKLREKRAQNSDIRNDMRQEISSIASDRAELESARGELVVKRDRLAAAKADRDGLLRKYERQEAALHDRMDHLEEDSAVLKRAIESGATSFAGGVPSMSASGLMWPVNGPVVSRFGMRWGRMHEGWDIAVPAGTPIHAAQSGVVTYAGWMSGYGNIVIVQHAGSLSTAYGHQSRLGSSVGQIVTQGQVIGFVGCTGHCFGDHVHFETRINGNAVDPDNYL